MPPAVDSISTTSSSGSGPFTWSHTCAGSDRLLLLFVAHYHSSNTISSASYNGVSMTAVTNGAAVTGSGYLCFITTFYLVAPATGSNTVSVTPSGGLFDFGACAISLSDVHQTVPLGTAANATGYDTTPTVTVSSATGELVVDGLVIMNSGTLTVGAGQTQHWNAPTANAFIRYAGSTESGAASTTMSWSNSSSQTWAIVAVPIKPTGGGSGGPNITGAHYQYRKRRL